MAQNLEEVFVKALNSAVRTRQTGGPLAGTFHSSATIRTEELRMFLLSDTTPWSTIAGDEKDKAQYEENTFRLVSDTNLFGKAIQVACGIHERFNVESFIRNITSSWTTTPVFEAFVLSKIQKNMTWHVDGGKKCQSDLVVYMVLGPSDSVSCFMFLAIDQVKLQEVQRGVQDGEEAFPTYEQIDKGLKALDDLNLTIRVPNLAGCKAILCGLSKSAQMNGEDVQIRSYDDRHQRYDVQLEKTGKYYKVLPGNLQLAPGYCPLPSEIQEGEGLSLVARRAVDAGVVCCYCIWGKEGDAVAFDGSKLHGVWNFASATNHPQLAFAVNYRGVVEKVEKIQKNVKKKREMKDKPVKLKLSGLPDLRVRSLYHMVL